MSQLNTVDVAAVKAIVATTRRRGYYRFGYVDCARARAILAELNAAQNIVTRPGIAIGGREIVELFVSR